MKKILLAIIAVVACSAGAWAQKFALVDMEYILKNIPAYEMANEQLNQVSLRWQKEVDDLAKEAENMYKNYQSDMVFLTDEQKKTKEEEIVAKEKEVTELRYKYFGPEGELFQKRQSLIKPIQDDVYAAVKKVSEERGYQVIFDRASSQIRAGGGTAGKRARSRSVGCQRSVSPPTSFPFFLSPFIQSRQRLLECAGFRGLRVLRRHPQRIFRSEHRRSGKTVLCRACQAGRGHRAEAV